jgi:hypothetical protein
MNLIEDLTKELQNVRDGWLHLMDEAHLMARSMSIPPYFPDTEKGLKKFFIMRFLLKQCL